MIIYRQAARRVLTRTELSRLRAAAADPSTVLIDVGALEQGIVDAIRRSADGWGETDALLRRATLASADAYLAARGNHPIEPALRSVRTALDTLATRPLPHSIDIRPPEGFVHYALDPDGYAWAAAQYVAAVGGAWARRAVVVGVRSIGTSLSAIVARVLDSPRSVTVRPRGETGDRRVRADASLHSLLAGWLEDGGDVLIVDEGPGATGETFDAVARWLHGLGVGRERLVLFPSRSWGMPLAPPERAAWFADARKFTPPPDDPRPRRIAARLGHSRPEDLSAGRWREVIAGATDSPACVVHERRKYRTEGDDGALYPTRYVGLGTWGAAAADRGERLAAAGVGPEVLHRERGFLVQRWIDGEPLGAGTGSDAAVVKGIGDYLSARARLFRTGVAVDVEPIEAMLVANVTEAFGPRVRGLAPAVRLLRALPAREAVIADARVQRWEWLRTPVGIRKADALDHGDGLRLPGPTDTAWDLAGVAIEFGLDDEALSRLIEHCAGAAGDDVAALREAVEAYRAPYAAYWLGDAMLSASEATTEADRQRFQAEARRYRRALSQTLECVNADWSSPGAA